MLKFFRRIRQQLLGEGKTGKYLKYAIGEIVLVVVGILIALSINNWNTNKNDVKKIEKYLSEVHNNIQSDTARIDTLVQMNSIKIENLKRTILYYYRAGDEPGYLDSIRAVIVNSNIGHISEFQSSKSGVNALIGSGDINLISDSVRIKLNKYYEKINLNNSQVERVTTLTRNVIQERLLKQVVDKDFVEEFIEYEIPLGKVQPKYTFIPDNDMPTDMMFLMLILNGYNKDLKEIEQLGLETIKAIENLKK